MPIEQTLATVTGTAGALGVHTIAWSSSPGNELYFFGAEAGPGTRLIIINTTFQVIPEPDTALLVGLGLTALTRIRRRN